MNELVKSPLNYTGGKYKLLPQILPLFPKDIKVFYDIFMGGGDVFLNVEAEDIVATDINAPVVSLFEHMWHDVREKDNFTEFLLNYIDNEIKRFGLSATDKDAYLAYRKYFNEKDYTDSSKVFDLLIMVAHSFCNQIRFNQKGDFNLPFGKRTFNDSMKNNLIATMDRLKSRIIDFGVQDFELSIVNLLEDCFDNDGKFVYMDPPYTCGCAQYNTGWSEESDKKLFSCIDAIDGHGIKFALSNVFENRGKKNEKLIEWCEKRNYNVHHLNNTYNNSSFRKSGDKTDEVLITNY